jgi:carbon-monoxide dehydrogenase medium subunit
MTPFELAEPRSISEALALLDPNDPSIRAMGGGTALMLMMKPGFFKPKRLVSLRKIAELAAFRVGSDGALRIGAMTRLSALERSAEVAKAFPVIASTLRTLSNRRVRNVATIGGHIAHADPHTDLPPVLIALDATIEIAGPGGQRKIPAEALATGYLETTLKGNELIIAVTIPAAGRKRAIYVKCTTRSADDWPALGIAVALDADGRNVKQARVVVSAATEKPVRLSGVEAILQGGAMTDASLREATRAAASEADITTDMQGSAAYKRHLLEVHLNRAISGLLNGGARRGA